MLFWTRSTVSLRLDCKTGCLLLKENWSNNCELVAGFWHMKMCCFENASSLASMACCECDCDFHKPSCLLSKFLQMCCFNSKNEKKTEKRFWQTMLWPFPRQLIMVDQFSHWDCHSTGHEASSGIWKTTL